MNHTHVRGFLCSAVLLRRQIIRYLADHIRLPYPRGLSRDPGGLMTENDVVILMDDSVLIHGGFLYPVRLANPPAIF